MTDAVEAEEPDTFVEVDFERRGPEKADPFAKSERVPQRLQEYETPEFRGSRDESFTPPSPSWPKSASLDLVACSAASCGEINGNANGRDLL